MANSISCPQCRASIHPGEHVYEGAVIACPACKSTLKVVADGRGRTETIPVFGGRSPVSSLPPRAPTPVDAPASRKKPRVQGGTPTAEQSRTAVAVFMLIGIGGLALLFVTWYVRTVQLLTKTADRASARRVARVESGFKPANAKTKLPQATLVTREPAVGRSLAPSTVQVGTLVVGVSAADIAPVTIHGNTSTSSYLVLTLRVTNLADKPLEYSGWQRSTAKLLLRDADRNYYNRIQFFPGQFPEGCVEAVAIQPTETIKDMLVFEAPSAPYKSLELDLPLTDASVFRFAIPGGMVHGPAPQSQLIVRREFSQPPPMPAVGSGTAANARAGTAQQSGAPKPSPAQDPAVRRSIIAEYRELSAQVERRAKGMSYDRGRQFRRTRRTEIIESLSAKYKLTVDEVREMLP